jgi:GntR family transcriptional regulator
LPATKPRQGGKVQRLKALNQSPVPRYIQLATLFRRRIETGHWKVGQQIPTVDALVAECGVARATIRQALDVLANERIIERFKAKGTFVLQSKEPVWLEMQTNYAGLLRRPEGAETELLSDTPHEMPNLIRHREIGEIAPSYRHLRRRHHSKGQTYLISDVYIDERISDAIPTEALTSKTAMKMVVDIPGVVITDVRQTLTISTADLDAANLLQVSLNAPIAFVTRSAVDREGFLIFINNCTYRGDVVRLDIRLR